MARKFYKEDNEAIPAIKFELTQPTGFTEITDTIELKSLFIGKYKQREIDGIDYFEEFRADLYLDILNGTYTDTEVFALETHLNELQLSVITGSWLTAKNKNTSLALSGIYDQAMKDEIQADIDTYVNDNY